MKCPLKFSRYEFEGGTDCIGAECGFYGCVCDMDMSVSVQKCLNELPEGDAVAIMRKAAKGFQGGTGNVMKNAKMLLDMNVERGLDSVLLETFADMVERDYVRRDDYDFTVEMLNCMKAERDELKKELSIANAKFVGKPECEICDRTTLLVEIEGLTAERDEWKAKVKTLADYSKYWHGRCAKLEYRSAKRAAAVERLKANPSDDTFEKIIAAAIGCTPLFITTRKTRDMLIDLLTADDGLRSNDGVTNLEWLFENDYETLCDQMGGQPCSCCVVGCKEDLGSDEACAKALREWLMAPHEDAHSKAQSITESNLTEQSESSSDESDSREKLEADALSFANGFIRDHNGAISWNDELYQGIIKLLDRQAAITEQECSVGHTAMRATIDRLQTTVDELYKSCDILRDKNRALKAHISKMQQGRHGWHVKGVELQRQVDELTAQLHASNAERARLRECLGIATDNAHDFLTLVDESGNVYDRDEGLA